MAELTSPIVLDGVEIIRKAVSNVRAQMEKEDYWKENFSEDYKAGVMAGLDSVLDIFEMFGKKKQEEHRKPFDNNSIPAGFEEDE